MATALNPISIRRLTWEWRIKSKLPDNLRHSHASLLVEKGFSPLLIAERLGHEKVQTTMDIYSHLYPNKQQEVARILNETIDPKSSDSAGYKKSEKM